jgi:hypothetical protein
MPVSNTRSCFGRLATLVYKYSVVVLLLLEKFYQQFGFFQQMRSTPCRGDAAVGSLRAVEWKFYCPFFIYC